MKIAIIGAGISGLTAAWLLMKSHDIVIYEANDYAGGHTHTIDVQAEGTCYAVDTGFIVFNEVTYPTFCRLLADLEVPSQQAPMEFSVRNLGSGVEFSPRTVGTLFAQGRNVFSLSFYRMLIEAMRLQSEFDHIIEGTMEMEIDRFLSGRGYSRRFIEELIIPLGASLWSSGPEEFRNFPVGNFARFFKNHGFLKRGKGLTWRVVRGGSRRYVEPLIARLGDRLRLSSPVKSLERTADSVILEEAGGEKKPFDHAVIAVHSDQALALLSSATEREREILGAIPYQENQVMLHTDTSLLPKRRALWASWNYLIPEKSRERVAVTYDMNILQSLHATREFLVTLNNPSGISKDTVIGTYTYHHPIYRPVAMEAQKRHAEISGQNRTHFCGAYWGYGFHEDGAKSALTACTPLGVTLH